MLEILIKEGDREVLHVTDGTAVIWAISRKGEDSCNGSWVDTEKDIIDIQVSMVEAMAGTYHIMNDLMGKEPLGTVFKQWIEDGHYKESDFRSAEK